MFLKFIIGITKLIFKCTFSINEAQPVLTLNLILINACLYEFLLIENLELIMFIS